jgi:aminopeptidase YwaD
VQRPAAFSASVAYGHVEALAGRIGVRLAGTGAEQRAADYVAEQFRSYGYQVERQPFNFLYFEDKGSTLAILGPQGRSFEARAMVYSRAGQARAQLVDAGLGRTEDFAAGDFQGKIALVKRGAIRFTDKARNAAQAGAVAVVVYNHEPGHFWGTLLDVSEVPIIGVSDEAGRLLLEALGARAVEAQLSVQTISEYRPSHNIVARWPGSAPTIVVVGGHYDSVAVGPGANDNASGVAVVLEAARALAGHPGVAFLAFGAEELGLWGSQSYVNSLTAPQRQQIVAVLNVDMVGRGRQLALEAGGGHSIDLQRKALAVAQELGIPAVGGTSDGGSDHVPFVNRGIPSLHFFDGADPDNHSARDTADKVSPPNLSAAGRIAVELAWRLIP